MGTHVPVSFSLLALAVSSGDFSFINNKVVVRQKRVMIYPRSTTRGPNSMDLSEEELFSYREISVLRKREKVDAGYTETATVHHTNTTYLFKSQ